MPTLLRQKWSSMQIKGIKQGRTIQIFEDLDVPDGQEIRLSIEIKSGFWQNLQKLRTEIDAAEIWIEPEVFSGVRDNSLGRDVVL